MVSQDKPKDMKLVKHVDYLYTFGSVKPSWISPLTNGMSRDGSFAGARYVTGLELSDGNIETDVAEANPPFVLVSTGMFVSYSVIQAAQGNSVLRVDKCADIRLLLAGLETPEN
jgi:hypothetical protein